NVGKSTLLSVLTKARPKIANYHFTTLNPNLGVMEYYDTSYVLADIPGLIEGASDGLGLGHKFLRHIERVRLIVHLIDISGFEGRDPYDDYLKIRNELKKYSLDVYNRPEIVVLNKVDLLSDDELIKEFEKKLGKETIKISAMNRSGLDQLKQEIHNILVELPKPEPIKFVPFEYDKLDRETVEIHYDKGVYYITGGFVEDLARKAYLDDLDSFNWFQKKLRDRGVIDMLHENGAKDGDTVCILDLEFTLSE
nr:Obg family GTPase CgtA [Clostridia bacterium]